MGENVYALHFSPISLFLLQTRICLCDAEFSQDDNGRFSFSYYQIGISGNLIGQRCVKLSVLDEWISIMSVGDPSLTITFQDFRILLAHLYKELDSTSHAQFYLLSPSHFHEDRIQPISTTALLPGHYDWKMINIRLHHC